MTGFKYKLAHKRADKVKWSSTDKSLRLRLIGLLEESINTLKSEIVAKEEEEEEEEVLAPRMSILNVHGSNPLLGLLPMHRSPSPGLNRYTH